MKPIGSTQSLRIVAEMLRLEPCRSIAVSDPLFQYFLTLMGKTKYLYFGYKKTTNTDLASSLTSEWVSYDGVAWGSGPCHEKDCYNIYSVGESASQASSASNGS